MGEPPPPIGDTVAPSGDSSGGSGSPDGGGGGPGGAAQGPGKGWMRKRTSVGRPGRGAVATSTKGPPSDRQKVANVADPPEGRKPPGRKPPANAGRLSPRSAKARS